MGWLPLPRVSATATRSTLRSKSGQPLERYFPEIVEHSAIAAGRRASSSTASWSCPKATRFVRRAAACGSIRRRAGSGSSRASSRRSMSCSTCSSTSAASRLIEQPLERATGSARALRGRESRRTRDFRLSPVTRARARRRVARGARAGARRGDRQAARPALPVRRRATGMQSTSACGPPTASSAASATAPKTEVVGSLLLGLYDDDGPAASRRLHLEHQGRDKRGADEASSRRSSKPPGFTGHAPGGPSRWSTERSGEWQPLDAQARRRGAATTISPAAASGTARSFSAGGPTRRRASARWRRSRRNRRRR